VLTEERQVVEFITGDFDPAKVLLEAMSGKVAANFASVQITQKPRERLL